MFVADGRVVYSASDLSAAATCEYALLRRFDATLERSPTLDVVDDDMLIRTAELGDEHERRILDDLVARFGDGVVRIGRPAHTVASYATAAAMTAEAFARNPAVVYQAAMFDGRFVGFADFVIRDNPDDEPARYQVVDTKLARHAKVTALLQIAAYADGLRAAGVAVAPTGRIVLGNGDTVDYPIADLVPVYRQQRAKLQSLLDRHLDSDAAVAWSDPTVGACMQCEFCVPNVVADDDLLLVAGMRMTQRAKLFEADITTVSGLAESVGTVDGMSAGAVENLRTQARLQLKQRATGRPEYQVTDPDALGALPPRDPGDLFFDFEGDPLWTDDGVTWGLEYLWGVLGPKGFHPLWAQDRADERKAFVDFLALVRKQLKRHPGMHVYHYASYERSTLLRLAARYGVGEDEVDDLLRAEVLVDLYPVVRNALKVGAPSYSLKALEPLYMSDAELRSGEVTNATASITSYERYRALRDDGRAAEAAAALAQIRDYNSYDCLSTRTLRDWLLIRAFECGVTHLTKPLPDGESVPPDDDTARTLSAFAGDAGVSAHRTPEQTAAALLNAARGYYQRERKPYWWAHFQRLTHPVDEWGDTTGVFLVEGAEVVEDWHKPSPRKKTRRHVRLTGVLQGGALGGSPRVLYDRPAPAGMDDEHPDRRAAWKAKVIECADVDGVPVEVLIDEIQPDGKPFAQLPMALTPAMPFGVTNIEAAIGAAAIDAARTLRESPPRLPRSAVVDILCRRAPATLRGASLPRLGDDVASITAALLDLDASYLAVHGPPGTGKTFTAAHVIATLVNEHGWCVGVVAQSHSVVAHLLDRIVDAGVDSALVAKKAGRDQSIATRFTTIGDDEYLSFLDAHPACVIGGTTWDFANDNRVPEGHLHLLAVDEAGQFSLGNTIAVARATRNLLLLGDPQQLGQVSTGSHPEPVDQSAMGWLTAGHDVLPSQFGYFLDRTHRMHPDVCRVVSALSYDGRLVPHPKTANRAIAGLAPGVRTLIVEHEGNSTSSIEEAAVIVERIAGLVGTPWTDQGRTRNLTQRDFLVVAPYNAQVVQLRSELQKAGLGDVLVGTVDKLQGREAPVVFVSMTASAVADVPRGMPFLLNRNRLNVAISRALYLAVVVRSRVLVDYLPGTPDGLVDLGAFLSLSPCDTPAR